jgi:hypothetical protein
MAKVPFSKLKCKIDDSIKEVKLNEEITIEVKQYLPIQEKLGLIGRVIELAHEQDANYSNPVKISVYRELEMIFAYTNIAFTEKQKEDSAKLYDMLISSGILKIIIDSIPTEEYCSISCGIDASIKAIYQYQNSALGILDGIKNNYNETEFDVENLQKAINDLSSSPLIKDIMPLLGLE